MSDIAGYWVVTAAAGHAEGIVQANHGRDAPLRRLSPGDGVAPFQHDIGGHLMWRRPVLWQAVQWAAICFARTLAVSPSTGSFHKRSYDLPHGAADRTEAATAAGLADLICTPCPSIGHGVLSFNIRYMTFFINLKLTI